MGVLHWKQRRPAKGLRLSKNSCHFLAPVRTARSRPPHHSPCRSTPATRAGRPSARSPDASCRSPGPASPRAPFSHARGVPTQANPLAILECSESPQKSCEQGLSQKTPRPCCVELTEALYAGPVYCSAFVPGAKTVTTRATTPRTIPMPAHAASTVQNGGICRRREAAAPWRPARSLAERTRCRRTRLRTLTAQCCATKDQLQQATRSKATGRAARRASLIGLASRCCAPVVLCPAGTRQPPPSRRGSENTKDSVEGLPTRLLPGSTDRGTPPNTSLRLDFSSQCRWSRRHPRCE
jgi:hypothetical protein